MENKVKVYGKSQNRTALGIVNAYLKINPNTTLEQLRKAFPNDINPDKGVKEIFIPANEAPHDVTWDHYFDHPGELLTVDGRKVAMTNMWTHNSFTNLVNLAKNYGIVVADFSKTNPGMKGNFDLEYLNNFKPVSATAAASAAAVASAEDKIKATANKAEELLPAAEEEVKTTIANATDNVKAAAANVATNVKDAANTATDNVKAAAANVAETVSNVKDAANTATDNVKAAATNVAETVSNVNLPKVGTPKVDINTPNVDVPDVEVPPMREPVAPKCKCSLAWLWWLLVLIILALILLWGFKGCCSSSCVKGTKKEVPTVVTGVKNATNKVAAGVKTVAKSVVPAKALAVTAEQQAQLAKYQKAFNEVEFNNGKANLNSQGKLALNNIVAMLKADPALKLQAIGHASADGSDQVNLRVSAKRAQNVVEYLESQGIAADRLSYVGWGEHNQVDPQHPYAIDNRCVTFNLSK